MSSFKINILSNYLGRISSIIINIILMGFIVKQSGFENFSIFATYTAVLTVIGLFDSGFTAIVLHEVSKNNKLRENNKIFTTIEFLTYINVLLLIALTLKFNLLFYLYEHTAHGLWNQCLIISIAGILRLPISLYVGILVATGKHGLMNAIQLSFTILRAIVVYVIVINNYNFVVMFYIYIFINIVEIVISRNFISRIENIMNRNKNIDFKYLMKYYKFAKGVLFIAISGAIINQFDKIFLIKFLNSTDYGIFSFASSLSLGIVSLVYPLVTSLSPRIHALHVENRAHEKNILFLKYSCIIFLLIIMCVTVLNLLLPELNEFFNLGYNDKLFQILNSMSLGIVFMSLVPLLQAKLLAEGVTNLIYMLNLIFGSIYLIVIVFLANKIRIEELVFIWSVLYVLYFFVLLIFQRNHKITRSDIVY